MIIWKTSYSICKFFFPISVKTQLKLKTKLGSNFFGVQFFWVKFKHQELHDSSGKKWVALTRAVCLFVMFGQLLRPCAAARELLRRCHCSNA